MAYARRHFQRKAGSGPTGRYLCLACDREAIRGGCGNQGCKLAYFASGVEFKRAAQLLLLRRAGAISDLEVHPRFDLVVNGQLLTTYVADFGYMDLRNGGRVYTVEDVKPPDWKLNDPVATLKIDLFRILHPGQVLNLVEMKG